MTLPCTARQRDDAGHTHRCCLARGHDGAHEDGAGFAWSVTIGGRRLGAGRPRLAAEDARTERVVVRVRAEELRALESAAGGPVGPWLRGVGLRAAKRR